MKYFKPLICFILGISNIIALSIQKHPEHLSQEIALEQWKVEHLTKKFEEHEGGRRMIKGRRGEGTPVSQGKPFEHRNAVF